MTEFNERLKQIRLKYNLTQKQLAELIGVTERGIQRYEANERKPTFDVLISLLDNLDISADYLLGRTDTDNPNINK